MGPLACVVHVTGEIIDSFEIWEVSGGQTASCGNQELGLVGASACFDGPTTQRFVERCRLHSGVERN